MKAQSQKGWMLGAFTAVAASLCCITPVLALISGVSGIAATFSWLDPARPYLVGITIAVLGFAWYQKLKPQKQGEMECACEENDLPAGASAKAGKPSFWQSKKFLVIVTVFAAIMLAFPYYSGVFFPDNNVAKTIIAKENDIVEANLTIKGMTCTGCEHSVNHALTGSEGVIEASSSYEAGTAIVKFDKTKVSIDELAEAVEKETGYKVTIRK